MSKKYGYLVFSLIFTIMIALGLRLIFIPSQADAENYPLCGIVIEVNYYSNTVSVKDFNGNIWVFYGAEDWMVNDIAAMIMDDMGTESIYDDEIKIVHYCGWVE